MLNPVSLVLNNIEVSATVPLPVAIYEAAGGAIVWADKTITSATGASQTLAAANAARTGLMIVNGASATGVNILGGTAAIGGAGTFTLQPFASVTFTGAETPVGLITVITTAAAYVSAFEGT